jgi:septal ring factor EnvC (AmiA/AmiB activator)
MNEKDTQKLIEAMAEVFPTATMMNNAFDNVQTQFNIVQKQTTVVEEKMSATQRSVAEVAADLSHLTANVEDLRELVVNVPTKHDLEHWLEKTYNFTKLQAEHDQIKKILKEKLHVDVLA